MFVEIAASNFDCKDSEKYHYYKSFITIFKKNNYEYSD